MNRLRKQAWIVGSLLCGMLVGCSSTAFERADSQADLSAQPEVLDRGGVLTVYPGAPDFKNRYISNVMVVAGDADPRRGCSGVLLNAKTVLTAAHCVCPKREVTIEDRKAIEARLAQEFPSGGKNSPSRKGAQVRSNILAQVSSISDGSKCLDRVSIYIINYLGSPQRFVPSLYEGDAVRPHPRFLSLEDKQDGGLFRGADLALVRVKDAVKENFRAIKLPEAEVYKDQPIVMVGFGLGETEYPTTAFGFRHYGESWVSKIESSVAGSTRFTVREKRGSREASRTYEGDSGGGGFSAADDAVLVGIISAKSDGEGTIFESVYPQVRWLAAALN